MAALITTTPGTETPLQNSNPYIEADLHLIIKAYEEGARKSGTEEGILGSQLGEIEKQRGMISSLGGLIDTFAGMESAEENESGKLVTLGKQAISKFKECIPCDDRVEFGWENLPFPSFMELLSSYLDQIENFIEKLKGLLDPTGFYSTICPLLDALRFTCPQDLIIVLALLAFLIEHYLTLSFKLDIDWIGVLGALLLPILMFILLLLDMVAQLGLGALGCFIDYVINFMNSLTAAVMSLEHAVETSVAAAQGTASSFREGQERRAGFDEEAEFDRFDEPEEDLDETSVGGFPKWNINIAPTGGYVTHKDVLGSISAIESLLLGTQDVKELIEKWRAKYKKAVRVLIDMLGRGLTLRMDYAAILVDLVRLVGLIRAITKAIQSDSVCTDPSQALSAVDIQALIDQLAQTNSLPSGVEIVIENESLTVSDTILETSKQVPSCLGLLNSEEQDKIAEWIKDLESTD